jgi:hypothetical protein
MSLIGGSFMVELSFGRDWAKAVDAFPSLLCSRSVSARRRVHPRPTPSLTSVTFSLPPDSPELDASAQFVVPRDAADALDIPMIIAAAERRGVKMPRIEMTTTDAGAGKTRISCRVAVAILLTQAWISVAEHAPDTDAARQLVVSLAEATRAAFAAIDDATTRARKNNALGDSGYIGPSGHPNSGG